MLQYDPISEHPGSLMWFCPPFHRARQPVPFAAQATFGQEGTNRHRDDEFIMT
jgi:hypothetical protein